MNQILLYCRMLDRLPWAWQSVLLTALSGFLQGFGLALFIPLLEILDGSPAAMKPPFTILEDVFTFMGVPFELEYLLLAVVLLNVAGLALNFAQKSLVMGYTWSRFIERTNTALIDGILQSSWRQISKQATGETTNQLINETIRAGRALTHLAISVAIGSQIIIFMVMTALLSLELLIVAAGFGGLTMLIVRPLQNQAVFLGDRLTETRKKFGFYVVDYLKNLKLIKATASEDTVLRRLSSLQVDVCGVISKRQVNAAGIQFVVQIFPVFVVACVIFISQIYLDLEIGELLVFLLFLARTVTYINQFQLEVVAFLMERSSVSEIDKELLKYSRERETQSDGKSAVAGLDRHIQFENVSFKFDDDIDDTIRDINLNVDKGSFVALVGASGAGKSTLVDLLCGLRNPTAGTIKVDGLDLGEIDLVSWRRHIGYVGQDVTIFNDTIRNNLAFSSIGVTDEKIYDAITLADLNDLIDTLPDGLDTMMGEDGVRLSGGQKQRLALARALVGNPSVLLLDEATSALDTRSERVIKETIEELSHQFTIIVVAHRLSTVRKADKIHVLEAGRIVESGTYDQLISAAGRFSELHQFQFDKMESEQ